MRIWNRSKQRSASEPHDAVQVLDSPSSIPDSPSSEAPQATSIPALPVTSPTIMTIQQPHPAQVNTPSASGGIISASTALQPSNTTPVHPPQPKVSHLMLTTTGDLLNACKTLSDLTSIPGLKIALDIAGQLVKLLDTKFRNDDNLAKIINETLGFVQTVNDACTKYGGNLQADIQEDINNFVQDLQSLQRRCEAYFKRIWFYRFIFATSWQNELPSLRGDMNTILQHLSLKNQIHTRAAVIEMRDAQQSQPQPISEGEVDDSFHGTDLGDNATVLSRVYPDGRAPPLVRTTAFRNAKARNGAYIVYNCGSLPIEQPASQYSGV